MSDHLKRYIKLVVNTAIAQLNDEVNRKPIGASTNYKTMLFYLAKILKKSPANLTESEIEKMFYIGNYGGKFDEFTLYCDKVLYHTGFVVRNMSSVFNDAVEGNGYSDTSSDLGIAFYKQFTKFLANEVKKPVFKESIREGKTSNQLAGRKITAPSKTRGVKKIYPPFVNVKKML